MRFRTSAVTLLLLEGCVAQRWKLHAACYSYDATAIEAAFTEAVNLAKTALDVLTANYPSNAEVTQMVKYILGDDANSAGKVETAKNILANVAKYDTAPVAFLGWPFTTNADLLIFCDNSNYAVANGRTRNVAIDAPLNDETVLGIQLCYNADPQVGEFDALQMAMTTSSDQVDMTRYKPLLDAWKAKGSAGPLPDIAPYAKQRPTRPNTMDLCSWYLKQKQKEEWPKVDMNTIAKIRNPDFISQLKNMDKPVDTLAQTLGGTLLHELTHTNLGGKTVDVGLAEGVNCYGWVCVGNLHNANNADSINILGVALNLWKLGFYVDNNGQLQPNP